MPITNGEQTVGTAVSQIDGTSVYQSKLIIHNNDTTKDLFLGGPDLTAANGLPLAKLQYIELEIPPLENIYMISSGTNHSVSWIRIEQD